MTADTFASATHLAHEGARPVVAQLVTPAVVHLQHATCVPSVAGPRVRLPRTHPRRHTCGRPRTGCSRGGSRSAAPLLQASRVTCHASARVMSPLTLEVAELLARRVRALLAPHPPGLRRRRHAPRHLPLPGGLHMEHCSTQHCSTQHCSMEHCSTQHAALQHGALQQGALQHTALQRRTHLLAEQR